MELTKIEACFIKSLRNDYGDSATRLCSEIGMNKTHLYDIEAGRKGFSQETFNKILSFYNVNYNLDNKLYDEAYNLTIKMYENYILKNHEEFKK